MKGTRHVYTPEQERMAHCTHIMSLQFPGSHGTKKITYTQGAEKKSSVFLHKIALYGGIKEYIRFVNNPLDAVSFLICEARSTDPWRSFCQSVIIMSHVGVGATAGHTGREVPHKTDVADLRHSPRLQADTFPARPRSIEDGCRV